MTDADIAELAGHLEAMRAAARNDDGHGVAEADARFHGRIVELADNGTLERVWRSLEPFSRTYITLVVPGRGPAVVGRPPRPDPRRPSNVATPRRSSPPSSATSTTSATTWRAAGRTRIRPTVAAQPTSGGTG